MTWKWKILVFSESTPFLDILHVMFLKLKEIRGQHVGTWLYPILFCCCIFILCGNKCFIKDFLTSMLYFYQDKQFAQNQTAKRKKSFPKNVTCKMSRNGVALENTNIFHFHVTKKLFKTYAWMRCQKNCERP